jgi:hypothetical protein
MTKVESEEFILIFVCGNLRELRKIKKCILGINS